MDASFICNICEKGYVTKTGVKEHYYADHLNKALYRCKKCKMEFKHKSHRSDHRFSCPNKEKEDICDGKMPTDPEIEKLFVRRKAIQPDIDPKVLEILDEDRNLGCEEEEPVPKKARVEQTEDMNVAGLVSVEGDDVNVVQGEDVNLAGSENVEPEK